MRVIAHSHHESQLHRVIMRVTCAVVTALHEGGICVIFDVLGKLV